MIPFNATPEERAAAMSDQLPVNPVLPNATVNFNVQSEPAQGAILKQPVVHVLTIVGVVAAAASAASQAGVLPGWVGVVSNGLISILAVFGVASPGIRKV